MKAEMLDTWNIHNRIVLYLLGAVAEEAFRAMKTHKGRSFAEMFAHIHNVRVMWLQTANTSGYPGAARLAKDAALDRQVLRAALEQSGQEMASLLERTIEAGGRVRGFKPHAAAFLGYLIAHESYHHGEIGIALRELGHPFDHKTAFGMWEWGVR